MVTVELVLNKWKIRLRGITSRCPPANLVYLVLIGTRAEVMHPMFTYFIHFCDIPFRFEIRNARRWPNGANYKY